MLRGCLGHRLRLRQAAAAALFPHLPRRANTQLDAALVLPCGSQHTVKVAWVGRHPKQEFNFFGEGWRAACAALELATGDVITVRAQHREDGSRLYIARTNAALQLADSGVAEGAQATAAEVEVGEAELAAVAMTPQTARTGAVVSETALPPITPLQPHRVRKQPLVLGPAVRLLLSGDSEELQIPLDAVEALGLGGKRGSVRVRLVVPVNGSFPVTFEWHERSADGARFLRAPSAQKKLRWHLSRTDAPCEVFLAPDVENATDLHVRIVDTPSSSGSLGEATAAAGGATTAAETGSKLSGKKRRRGSRRARKGIPSPESRAAAAPAAADPPVPPAARSDECSAQQTLLFTVPDTERSAVTIPQAQARAASLCGDPAPRVVVVSELGREITLSMGWQEGSYRLRAGWRAFATAMGLHQGEKLLFTVSDGTVCRIARANGAAAGVSSAAGTSADNATQGTGAGLSLGGAGAPQAHDSDGYVCHEGVGYMTRSWMSFVSATIGRGLDS